jgi:LmbE family N-acetylglucosaminyl deacetylase
MSTLIATFRRLTVLIAAVAAQLSAQTHASGSEEIRQALEKAGTLGTVLMIAAHPDDENTAVMSWLAQGRHMRTGYLSLTRGEGGQNLIGSEQGDALGVIRTQELLAARRIDGAQQFFTRAIDFGFSKSPQESIAKWGHGEILSDVVWVIRSFRPDVIILRFSGTPRDGHGQHQASAILGKEAFDAAADPKRFPEQLKYVQPWRAKRLVWNAFSWDGDPKDKDKMMKVDLGAYNPVLGMSYGEIAGWSRSQHRSQGMGAPEQRGSIMNYFQNVAGDPARDDMFEGVKTGWDRIEGGDGVGQALAKARQQFNPEHPEEIIALLAEVRGLMSKLEAKDPILVKAKESEVDQLLKECAGIWLDAAADRYQATPGSTLNVSLTALARINAPVRWESVDLTGVGEATETIHADLAQNQPSTRKLSIKLAQATPYSEPFWLSAPHNNWRYDIADQRLVARPDPLPAMTAHFKLEVAGTKLALDVPVHYRYINPARGELTRPLEIVPPVAVNLPEPVAIFPNEGARDVTVQLAATGGPAAGELSLEVPSGWTVSNPVPFNLETEGSRVEIGFHVKPPAGADSVRVAFRAVAKINGREVSTGVQPIEYEHIPPQALFHEAKGALQPVDFRVLAHNIGYVMGAGDKIPDAVRQMGAAVTLLNSDDLMSGDLSRYDAIVTGVRAYNVRPDLRAAQPRLLEYVRNGGTVVVQYNVGESQRPNARASSLGPLGPYPFEISRERVVEEDSPVRFLEPECTLLRAPNEIKPSDFQGWVQERGLYFANHWDPHYQTVLSTHDAGEKDLPGGMLYARYGKGAYIFTAYSWFRELPAGVPGAYRIFANLLSAGKVDQAASATAPKVSGPVAH